ncbi:MAG TPA: YfhO family protein [Acidimicrobiia bacterium]
MPRALASLAAAAVIAVAVFPEVVFLGGSLSPVGLAQVVGPVPTRTVSVYPSVGSNAPTAGIRDIGARVWQLVPATKIMKRAIWSGESPFWNPYPAAGSLGPETLADIKFSPFVLSIALLGASATAFTFVTLAFIVGALFCLQELFTRTFRASRVAATASCIVWLLTGFAVSDVNSQIGAPYVLFPVLLYALVEYQRRRTISRFLAAVAVYSGFILTTFVSIQVLVLLFVHAVLWVFDVSHPRPAELEMPRTDRIRRQFSRQIAVPIVAAGLTAYVWIPDVVAALHGGADLSLYGKRVPAAKANLDLLKVLTRWPMHDAAWSGYIGIVALMLLAVALPRAEGLQRRLLVLAGVLGLFALTQQTGFVFLRPVGYLPGFRSINADYWAALAGASIAVGVGVAVSVIEARGPSAQAARIAGGVFTIWLAASWIGSAVTGHPYSTWGFVAATLLVLLVVVLVHVAATRPHRHRALAMIAVVLMAFELFSYHNHVHIRRVDVESSTPQYVTFLQQHLDGDRILNAGRAGLYPEWGEVFGIPQLETVNIMQIPSYRAFYVNNVDPTDPGLFLEVGHSAFTPFSASPTALDLMSVKYLVVDQGLTTYDTGVRAAYPLAFVDQRAGVRVYENPQRFPRAYLSPALTRADAPDPASGFSEANTITQDSDLLSAASRAGMPPTTTGANVGTAQVVEYRNDQVRVEVDAETAAVLVLTDSYYRGWHVTVNGKSQHLARVDETVRGVLVPAGQSTVLFRYRPPARSDAAWISTATIVLLAALVLSELRVQMLARAKRIEELE